VIAFATTIAMYQEAMLMVESHRVTLADLLLMFLYLEVLAMIGQYFKSASCRCVSRCISAWWPWRAT